MFSLELQECCRFFMFPPTLITRCVLMLLLFIALAAGHVALKSAAHPSNTKNPTWSSL